MDLRGQDVFGVKDVSLFHVCRTRSYGRSIPHGRRRGRPRSASPRPPWSQDRGATRRRASTQREPQRRKLCLMQQTPSAPFSSMARPPCWRGSSGPTADEIVQADISAIEYTIYELDDADATSRTPVDRPHGRIAGRGRRDFRHAPDRRDLDGRCHRVQLPARHRHHHLPGLWPRPRSGIWSSTRSRRPLGNRSWCGSSSA